MRRAAAAALTVNLFALALLGASVGAGVAAAAGVLEVQSGGYGHGIGLSQYGAYGYALHGRDYRFILAHYYQGTRLELTDPARIIRVLLDNKGQPTFSGASKADRTLPLKPGTSYTVQPRADGTLQLTWRGRKRGKPAVFTLGPFRGALTVTGPGPVDLAGKGAYRGTLVFRAAGGPDVETVDELGLDDYVRGVVAAEVPSSWPAPALQAQAVAARTYAITTNVGGADYDLYPDTRSQMYGGVGSETPATDAAVAATSGQVVTYNGVPVVTYFSSSSGGHTESIQNVWPGTKPKPWLVGVPDPYDRAGGANPYHRVVRRFDSSTAAARLAGLFKGQLVGVRVLRHGVSPRVITAQVVGTGGSSQTTGTELQKRLGLPTTWAVFTMLSAEPGSAPGGNGGTAAAEAAAAARAATAAPASARAQTVAVRALVPLVDLMLIGAIPGMHGAVFPLSRLGGLVGVQLYERGRWRDVGEVAPGADGRFDLALPGRGTYRARYRTVTTPAITVH
ncbi:MAG: SpoIID/LytB domain-containing protein [Solirubrobacteraceae bacterium]